MPEQSGVYSWRSARKALSGQPLCSQVAKGCVDKLQKLRPV